MSTNHKFVVKTSHLLRSVSILDKVASVEYLVLVDVLTRRRNKRRHVVIVW